MGDPTIITNADLTESDLQHLPPSRVLAHIQSLFKKWGIYNQKLILRHEGEEYAFSCDDKALIIYRLLSGAGKSPGSPGWPVCLVTAEGIIDECSPPHHIEDFFASHMGLADWLAIIEQDYEET